MSAIKQSGIRTNPYPMMNSLTGFVFTGVWIISWWAFPVMAQPAETPLSPGKAVTQRLMTALKDADMPPPFQVMGLHLESLEGQPLLRLEGRRMDAHGEDGAAWGKRLLRYLESLEQQHHLSVIQNRPGRHRTSRFSVWLQARKRPETMVVLMAQEDGSVGAVAVSSRVGVRKEQLLDKPGETISMGDDPFKPAKRFVMSEEEIKRRLGALLAIEPIPPRTYLLYFNSGESTLNQEAKRKMVQVLADIKRRRFPEEEVIGHTDTVGQAARNAITGRQRAEGIAERIRKEAGLSPERLSVESMGENKLLVPTADSVPEPRNRRVEVTIR